MRVLGAYMIGRIEQRQLFDGRVMDLLRDRVIACLGTEPAAGDALWLKEPWTLAVSREFGPQSIREAIPGPVGTRPPLHIAKKYHLLRQRQMSAAELCRSDSRITFEVLEIGEATIRVQVHFQQVDTFIRSRSAA